MGQEALYMSSPWLCSKHFKVLFLEFSLCLGFCQLVQVGLCLSWLTSPSFGEIWKWEKLFGSQRFCTATKGLRLPTCASVGKSQAFSDSQPLRYTFNVSRCVRQFIEETDSTYCLFSISQQTTYFIESGGVETGSFYLALAILGSLSHYLG